MRIAHGFRCRTSTYGMIGFAAALMLASAPLSAQAPLTPGQIDSIVNDILGGNNQQNNQRNNQAPEDAEDTPNICTEYWEATTVEEYCPNATVTFTPHAPQNMCAVEATCSVTTYVLNQDGSLPQQHTTWTALLDLETDFTGINNLALCFAPDGATQTYTMTVRTPVCNEGEVQARHYTGYVDSLPYIPPSS